MAMNDITDEYHRLIVQVNKWIADRRILGMEAIKGEVENWQTSQLANRFKLAELALLGDHSKAYSMAIRMRQEKDLAENEWREWPLLEEVRAYAEKLSTDH